MAATTTPAQVLIVEDEAGIVDALVFVLGQHGFSAQGTQDLAQARLALHKQSFDAVILDLKLPDGSGLDLLRELRAQHPQTLVLILTSRDEELDRILGLELGADDYITKPFSTREVAARVRAVLRRARGDAGHTPTSSTLQIDPARRRARYLDVDIQLTRTEFDLLALLSKRPGRVYTRDQLLDAVWGADVAVGDRTVDTHIKTLRKALRLAGTPEEWIETVRGLGYRMRE